MARSAITAKTTLKSSPPKTRHVSKVAGRRTRVPYPINHPLPQLSSYAKCRTAQIADSTPVDCERLLIRKRNVAKSLSQSLLAMAVLTEIELVNTIHRETLSVRKDLIRNAFYLPAVRLCATNDLPTSGVRSLQRRTRYLHNILCEKYLALHAQPVPTALSAPGYTNLYQPYATPIVIGRIQTWWTEMVLPPRQAVCQLAVDIEKVVDSKPGLSLLSRKQQNALFRERAGAQLLRLDSELLLATPACVGFSYLIEDLDGHLEQKYELADTYSM